MRYRGAPRLFSRKNIYIFLYPGTPFFVIFWFPIVIPLLINLIASVTELSIQLSSNARNEESIIWNVGFLILLFKNSYLAFISTDLWALTTTLMYSAKGSLKGWRPWVYGCAAVIALFIHLFFYIVTMLVGSYESDLWVAYVLFVAGCISVLWMRYVIFHAIENAIDWEEMQAVEK